MTLILVHLSSLDSYAWQYGAPAASRLADALITTCWEHQQVIVLDQDWPLSPDSRARCHVATALASHPAVIRFAHDEETDGWVEPMQQLAGILHGQNITQVTIGGVWATTDGLFGCVNATADALTAHGITTTIDPRLCGYDG